MLVRLARALSRAVAARIKRPDKKGRGAVLLPDSLDISQREAVTEGLKLVASLEANLESIREITGSSYDVGIREFRVGTGQVRAAIIYLDGLVDTEAVEGLIHNLAIEPFKIGADLGDPQAIYQTAKERLVPQKAVGEATDFDGLWTAVSTGVTAILFDGTRKALLVETRAWETRAIEEPLAEVTIRGPREGFIESLRVNTSLIRRRVRTPHLQIKIQSIGKLTRTEVAYAYIKGLASEDLVKEAESRLQKIDIDGVLESGYLEEYIEDNPFTVFPVLLRTERPDVVASALLQGRMAVFTEGSPFVLVFPVQLNTFLQAPDDYYERYPIGTLLRAVRYTALAFSVLLPGVYVAVVSFHQELLPTDLLMRITASREGVPFPVVAEVLIMEGLFEMLREAGIRLPRAIGPAITIVGALILGDAAIRAGLVSPAVVIVVALTAIGSFSAPVFSLAIAARLLRFAFIVLAGALGLFGIQFGLLVLLTHLSALRSFGRPYFAPFAPLILRDLKDAIVRVPWWQMSTRPKLDAFREPQRQPKGQRPKA